MDTILGKFGLFDIFSMLIPGVIIEGTAVMLFPRINTLFCICDLPKWFIFIMLGYLLGLALHEIISFFPDNRHKITMDGKSVFSNPNDLVLAKTVKASIPHLEKTERKITENADRYMASVCTNDLEINGKSGKTERLQTLAEMSFSLSLGFLVLSLAEFALSIGDNDWHGFAIGGVTLAAGVLFGGRGFRMQKYYLRCLIRTYAVEHGLQEKLPVKNHEQKENVENIKCLANGEKSK